MTTFKTARIWSAFVITIINAIFLILINSLFIIEDGTLLCFVLITYSGCNLLSHVLLNKFFDLDEAYNTVVIVSIFVLSILFYFIGHDVVSICLAWACLDLVTCIINIVYGIKNLKLGKIYYLELISQIINVGFNLLLIIDAKKGLPIHLYFCAFELAVDAFFIAFDYRKEKIDYKE